MRGNTVGDMLWEDTLWSRGIRCGRIHCERLNETQWRHRTRHKGEIGTRHKGDIGMRHSGEIGEETQWRYR